MLSGEDDQDTIIVERDNQYQFEYLATDKSQKLRLWVIWKDECTYLLRDPKDYRSSTKKILPGDVINKIIETGDDYYIVRAWIKGQKKFELKVYVYPEQ